MIKTGRGSSPAAIETYHIAPWRQAIPQSPSERENGSTIADGMRAMPTASRIERPRELLD